MVPICGNLLTKNAARMATANSPRDALVDDVFSGSLTPTQAEAEAARLGIGPLQARPDPSRYKPMRELWWTLPMAVAWIAYRTEDAVREWWPDYRAECTHWFDPDGQGQRLVPFSPASLTALRIAEQLDDRTDRDPDYSMTVDEAIGALFSGMRSCCVETTGITLDMGQREHVPDLAWRELAIIETEGDMLRPVAGAGKSYRDVLVRMGNVRGPWGVRPPEPEPIMLPPLMRPEGGGYMPLYCAAQWIATEGGRLDFDGRDTDRWRPAYSQLLARIASEEVKVIGFRDGRNEPLPGYRFAGIKVVHPLEHTPIDLILSDEMHLQSYCYTDEQSWLEGPFDTLEQYRREKWERLSVLKSDIASHWPFGDAKPDESDLSLYRTGAPGRPTSMQFVLAEFDRRFADGLAEESVTREAEALAAWLKRAHPHAPQLTAKAIKNKIGPQFRTRKNA